jgi:hypothetical protein
MVLMLLFNKHLPLFQEKISPEQNAETLVADGVERG